jgi:hypothetical protein
MNALDEDWKILVGLLPPSWQRLARMTDAVERLRGFDSVNEVLRVLLMHVGCGYSLRETAVRAKPRGGCNTSVGPCWRKVGCDGKRPNLSGACAPWTGR